jgi:hypothetical protein
MKRFLLVITLIVLATAKYFSEDIILSEQGTIIGSYFRGPLNKFYRITDCWYYSPKLLLIFNTPDYSILKWSTKVEIKDTVNQAVRECNKLKNKVEGTQFCPTRPDNNILDYQYYIDEYGSPVLKVSQSYWGTHTELDLVDVVKSNEGYYMYLLRDGCFIILKE